MLVTGYLLIWAILSFFISPNIRKLYIFVISLALPILYFGFSVDSDAYDISRYFIILDQMQEMSLYDVLRGKSSFINIYIGGTCYTALIYFWIISQFGVNEILPYITGVIVYYTCFSLVCKVSKQFELSNFEFGIVISYILFLVNYGEISGVRNILTFALCAYVLYTDFVEEKNKFICFGLYILLFFFHTSMILVLILRLFLTLRKIVSFRVIAFCCLFSNLFFYIIKSLFLRFSKFDAVNAVLEKMVSYSERTEYNYRLVFGSLIILIFCFIIALCTKNNENNKYFQKYYEFTVCIVTMAIGGIWNDVVISRLSTLSIFISIPYVVFLMHSLTKNLLIIRVKSEKNKMINIMSVIGLYIIIIFFAFFHLYFSYMSTFNHFF